ncbi:MAG TPA: hypothetical protein VGO70_09375 [Arsenicitalea sp.]|jgi:hypothetical protein|nr:hypothetical protein [Arsenicitalea sp.]
MTPPPVYERAYSDGLENVVTVKIVVAAGDVAAEVIWPANNLTGAGDYLYATHVPLALERAHDVCQNYGFRAVVILIEDRSLWNDVWGILIETESG